MKIQTYKDKAHYNPQEHFSEIKKSIDEKGFWEIKNEWQFFVITTSSIAKIEELNPKNKSKGFVFVVTVKCDYEFRCECPTLERAVAFCEIFQKWIEEGSSKYGWPDNSDKHRQNS